MIWPDEILAQNTLPDAGTSFGDIISNPAISTPGGAAVFVLGYIAQQYFKGRSEKRLDKTSDRESESGIVETTKEALKAAREQIAEMRQDRAADRIYNEQQEQKIRSLETRLARAIRLAENLQQEKEDLSRALDDKDMENYGGGASIRRGGAGENPALTQIPGAERGFGTSSGDTVPIWREPGQPLRRDSSRSGHPADPRGDGPGRHRYRSEQGGPETRAQ